MAAQMQSIASTSARGVVAPRRRAQLRVSAVAELERLATQSASRRGVPEGTPVVPVRDLPSRPRRNRKSETVRRAFSETFLHPANFILPVFVHDGDKNIPIDSMPGVARLGWQHGLVDAVAEARSVGVNQVVIFPKTPEELKTPTAEEAFNPNGLAQRTISLLKDKFPDLEVYTDVALDPYNSDGHDGIVSDAGVILNDETIEYLCRQAVSQARAGADCVSPSDMMDGRVAAIRGALDAEDFTDVSIMAYTAKYASAFYGPFRDALASAPKPCAAHRRIPPNKKTYQQDPANFREALREALLDEAEGADIMMVKPGLPYLDVIRLLRDNSALPIAAYHVSGEYAMLKAAAERGWLNEKDAVLEALLCLKRAGSDLILSYYATEAAKWMADDKPSWR
ncbi:hypothetical protein CHLNCDRAFT_137125 [Chlorella variabilis]|uniref:Delta-aminolevulinic acid dehydratase n=1 Tax=Chlorella variabilis TaxID=554065 RepID=E1ZLA4_CHLVA|nr:hypothetical protein CHLNCDRAFT_137125 [Chlorella variabilis]EFN53368.1 hypothetical protein CHLNCDRAFT_137125 [Chlorella variabilis]|eukprot:XP_005845470.1 hypothetical protein CHLNCDRAFT_137125 [Chlorella variabilis]